MQAMLYLQGSENEVYEVLFLHRDDIIYMACTCRAGAFSQLCRHKLAVLRGDPAALQEPGQKGLLLEVQNCLAQSPVASLSRQLYALQARLDLLNQEAKILKTAIESEIKNIRPNARIWKNP